MNILIIVPAYNEESKIAVLLDRIAKFHSLKNLLVVDDGSTDNTSSVAKKHGAHVITHSKNCGKGAALKTGFKHAIKSEYDAVITLDADLQHKPEEIPKFILFYKENTSDIIIGTRDASLSNMPFMRLMVNHTTSLATSLLSGVRIRDSQSGFRLIDRKVLESVGLKTSRFQTETEILIRAAILNFTIDEIEIDTLYFKDVKSHINPITDTLRSLNLFIRMLWR